MFGSLHKKQIPTPDNALPGRSDPIQITNRHYVLETPLLGPYPPELEMAMFGMGCFWGAEKGFWVLDGVHTTAVGYAGGYTPNPTYREVCSGRTGHNEVVRVVYDPRRIEYASLLATFWESHDPTQGMRQGNDLGTQYRSGIYTYDDHQRQLATESFQRFQERLKQAGFGEITTELISAPDFYFAEDYHQQYLAKNPGGYCGLGGTGVCMP